MIPKTWWKHSWLFSVISAGVVLADVAPFSGHLGDCGEADDSGSAQDVVDNVVTVSLLKSAQEVDLC